MSEHNIFGKKLKEYAKKFGGVGKLAEEIDMSQSQLSQYISGKMEPGKTILTKLSATGCDMNWLLKESENDYNILSEVEALSKEISEMKEVIKELKEMNGELNYKLRRLEREKEELEKENEQIRDQSARIAALGAKSDHEKNKRLKK